MDSISLANNPNLIISSIFMGIVPSVLWLFFWLREDDLGRKEPMGLITLTFLAGMLSVILVIPIEKFIGTFSTDKNLLTFLWAGSEEILKFLAFIVIMSNNEYLDEPVDYPIYLMTAALGFAALENAMYLIHPLSLHDTTVSLITGNMRFLGSTLLHSISSGIIGISIGLAFFKSKETKILYALVGISSAITLHTIFNFFIMKNNGENFLQVFGFLWVVTIIIMLLFEKLRRMGTYVDKTNLSVQ